MINNDVRLIGVALSEFTKEENGKITAFRLELTKQKSGEPYELVVKAYLNSKSINFNEQITGKTVVAQGFIDDKYNIIASNVVVMPHKKQVNASTPEVEVVTSKDLENKALEITDDDLPF